MNNEHHLSHASCAFYNSGFDKASILVVDGAGSLQKHNINDYVKGYEDASKQEFEGYEAESIWVGQHPGNFDLVYKSYGGNEPNRATMGPYYFDEAVTITKTYEAITEWLGWHALDGGKTMGLAPYGKQNPKIPQLFKKGRGNRDVFLPRFPRGAGIDVITNPIFRHTRDPKIFHQNQNELLEIEADLAWQIQNDTQEEIAKLIEASINLTGLNKICVVGGYGLNCVANYFIKKKFPNLEIHHEPISHDGGTAVGAAKYTYYKRKNDSKKIKQTSIYLGPKYPIKQINDSIKNYNNMFNIHNVKPEDVAELISKRNIVTIFQGRSEAGPRALGNRSILYDPTDPNGKDFVNKVKKREWFRPFAGTVLLEKANEWFDMAGLEESPFMMYAMDVWPNKQEQIQAITHVDGTCRIQTVTEEQNPHYYKLIQEFEKITGVPILFNTSFNLAGDPLVETIEDALETMLKSEMKYMYVPELGYLLEKKQ